MRKLGNKNKILFLILIILFIFIISTFGYFIYLDSKKDKNTYTIPSGSVLFDIDNNYLALDVDGEMMMDYDNNYYLSYLDSEGVEYKSNLGSSTIIYKEGDYKLYLYGNAYKVGIQGDVEKLSGLTEIVKAGSPYFYKISDRKYLFVDKKLYTDDKTISTTDYLIIDIDKQGNASFTNFENNVKTIGTLALKGTLFDFDIPNEALIYGDKTIDLKNVIGSSNNYIKPTPTPEEEKPVEDTSKVDNEYYDSYLTTIKDSFNNVVNSINGINSDVSTELNKDQAYLDLTRWTTLKSIVPGINSLTIKYSVFDPNNEYSEVFVIYNDGVSDVKVQLSKSDDSYTISGLTADKEYTIKYGYRVVASVGDSTVDVLKDDLKVRTANIKAIVKVNKVQKNTISFRIMFQNGMIPDAFEANLYVDDVKVSSKNVKLSDVSSDGVYSGMLDYNTTGSIMNLKIENLLFGDTYLDYNAYAKFVY